MKFSYRHKVPAALLLLAGTCVIAQAQDKAKVVPVRAAATGPGSPLSAAVVFFPLTAPCRAMDTRSAANFGDPVHFTGQFGPPSLVGGVKRDVNLLGVCGIPGQALGYSLNVTVQPPGAVGYLSLWPAGQPWPGVSTLNSSGGIVAAAAIVPAGTGGAISLLTPDPTDVILDVNGYFAPVVNGVPPVGFHPLAPCRIVDTRGAPYSQPGAFGPPSLQANESRSLPLLTSTTCKGIPANSQAYALNITVVPKGGPVYYLTAWPTGQPQPGSSTLNSFGGTLVSNLSIVPAGTNGAISVFVTNAADIFIDISGYFAP